MTTPCRESSLAWPDMGVNILCVNKSPLQVLGNLPVVLWWVINRNEVATDWTAWSHTILLKMHGNIRSLYGHQAVVYVFCAYYFTICHPPAVLPTLVPSLLACLSMRTYTQDTQVTPLLATGLNVPTYLSLYTRLQSCKLEWSLCGSLKYHFWS